MENGGVRVLDQLCGGRCPAVGSETWDESAIMAKMATMATMAIARRQGLREE